MKKTIRTLALAAVCCLSASAQEKLFNSASVQSPVVNPDGTVTFSIYAPKAIKVEVTGDFLPTRQMDVPGYGKYGGNTIGLTYHLIYQLPFKKK
jgi:enterochelin esterase family protein